MKNVLTILTICGVISLSACAAGVAMGQTDVAAKHEEMLYPVVRVGSGRGTGSGTVIFSEGKPVETYILTAWHVVRNAEQIRLYWPAYDGSTRVGTNERIADVIAHDADADLALLRSRDTSAVFPFIAALQGPDDPLELFETIIAVGSPLGLEPLPTIGILSGIDVTKPGESDDRKFLLTSAPVVFGNSGGGTFHFDDEDQRWELIGVTIQIPNVPVGPFGRSVVPHLHLSAPMAAVRTFLETECFGYIVDAEPCEPAA